jgi:integron integrase
MEPSSPPLSPPPPKRLLDQVRERARYLHYSLSTEKVYLYWVRFFIRWHQMKHPRDMGAAEVEAFLSMLATQRKVSSSTHNQALSALLFLYREVLGLALPWLDGLQRPGYTRRIPSVLTKDEVAAMLSELQGETALVARLLYGTGMRLMEGLRLRIKDVDFERHAIVVREAKGNKDRVVMLPRSLAPALREQLLHARAQWDADRRSGRGGVEVPHALEAKYPQVGSRWPWFWIQARAWSAGIICIRTGFSAGSSVPRRARASSSPSRCTRCAIPSPRTCFRPAPTSAPCRNSWATAT